MEKFNKVICSIIAVVLAVFLILMILIVSLAIPRPRYSTTDIQDYGKYIGNNDNAYAQNFITSFFPESICDYFTDITYSYRAQKDDAAAFEAYLEFSIQDPSLFQEHISQIAPMDEWRVFSYDKSYQEYVISDWYEISNIYTADSAEEADYGIAFARVGKVLYSQQEQKLIYVAIGAYDGGGAKANYLCVFFERFQIDPKEFSENSKRQLDDFLS